jgi:hypothetical protein
MPNLFDLPLVFLSRGMMLALLVALLLLVATCAARLFGYGGNVNSRIRRTLRRYFVR